MNRRRYLAAVGALSTTILAGCASDDGQGTTDGDSTPSEGADTEADPTAAGENTGTGEGSGDASTETEADTEAPETEQETATEAASASFEQTFEGSGTSTSDAFELQPGPIIAEYSHDGESNFIAELITREGESYEDVLVVNVVGSVEGEGVAAVRAPGGHNLNVEADGEWTITLNQPGEPSPQSLPVDASGEGPGYAGPFEFDGVTEFQGSHDGESNFIVEAIPADPSAFGDIVFNEIGTFEGSTSTRLNGIFYFSVDADGEWSLATN